MFDIRYYHRLDLCCPELRFLRKSQRRCQGLSSMWPNTSVPSSTTSGRRWPTWCSTVSGNFPSSIWTASERTTTGNQCTCT